jgi:hypothetical protein
LNFFLKNLEGFLYIVIANLDLQATILPQIHLPFLPTMETTLLADTRWGIRTLIYKSDQFFNII